MKANQDTEAEYAEQVRHFRQAWYSASNKLKVIERKIYSKKLPNYIRDILDSLKGTDRLRVRISNLNPRVKFPPRLELEFSINAIRWNEEIDFGNSLYELAISLSNLQYAKNYLFAAYNNLSNEMKRGVIDPNKTMNQLIHG